MNTPKNQHLSIGLRIFPTHIVQYSEHDRSACSRSNSQIKSQLNLALNKPNGVVSYKSAKKIRNAVNWLVASSVKQRVFSQIDKRTYQFKVNFITLTLPSLNHGLTDHQFKNRLLKNWLARMQYKCGLKNYVWKVETQANGNIHAHITSDCFIHYSYIRDSWNSLLIKNGLMKDFAAKHGHSDPNSTDVAAVHSIKDLAAYLAKYFSKSDEQRRGVSGRLWSCSYTLSDSNVCNIICPPDDDDNILKPIISSSAECIKVESEPNQFGRRRHLASVYIMRPNIWKEISGSAIHDNYTQRLLEIRSGQPINSIISQKLKSYAYTSFNAKKIPASNVPPPQCGSNVPPSNRDANIENSTLRKNVYQYDLFQIDSRLN